MNRVIVAQEEVLKPHKISMFFLRKVITSLEKEVALYVSNYVTCLRRSMNSTSIDFYY